MRKLSILVLVFLTFACNKEDVSNCNDNKSLYSLSNYPIGVAIDFDQLNQDAAYKSIALNQFNSVSPENIFKAEYIHPDPNFFYWTDADSLASFCTSISKRLFGHTLIWHKQLPKWILNFQGNTSEWDSLMKNHIQTIVKHFKNKINAWDVVNEAFNEDGMLRNSIWKEKIGNAYIEKAFQYAHEADPDALLFYNDYNLESNVVKRQAVIAMLNDLRSRGVEVNGIGLQMHISILFPEPMQIADAFEEFVNHSYRIHVSELDISINPYGKNITPSIDLYNDQANLLASIVSSYNAIPSNLQYGITFWGISDKNSWIRTYYDRVDYPLLFDDNYLPKPCYCKLRNTL